MRVWHTHRRILVLTTLTLLFLCVHCSQLGDPSSLLRGSDLQHDGDRVNGMPTDPSVTSELLTTPANEPVWMTTYEGPRREFPGRVLKTADDGFFVFYYQFNMGDEEMDRAIRLMRADSEGGLIWDRIIADSSGADRYPVDMIATSGGGFVAACSSWNYTTGNCTLIIFHLDSLGNPIQNSSLNIGPDSYPYSVLEPQNGEYLFACRHYNDTDLTYYLRLIWTDTDGYPLRDIVYDHEALSVAGMAESDGDVSVLTTDSLDVHSVLCVNGTGDHQWTTVFAGQWDSSEAAGVDVTSDNGYVVAGTAYDDYVQSPFLFKLDHEGHQVWNKTYDFGFSCNARDLVLSADDSIGFAGCSLSVGYHSLLVRTNATGHVLWNATYDVANNYTQAYSLAEISSDVYAVSGSYCVDPTVTPSYNRDFDLWLAKFAKPASLEAADGQLVEVGVPFAYDLDAESALGIGSWWLNDTLRFSVDEAGTIENRTFLGVGDYGVQVWANDTGGRMLSTSFAVSVIDTLPPIWLEAPGNPAVEYGVDFSYELKASDYSGLDSWWVNSSHFTIDQFGRMRNSTPLSLGVYPLMVGVNDTFGHVLSAEFTVTVSDTVAPLPLLLDDITYEVGSPAVLLTWTCYELLPSSYEIFRNGSRLESGPWNGSQVSILVSDLDLGEYNYTAIFWDTSSHKGRDTVIVTGVDTTYPEIDHPLDVMYVEGIGGNSIRWKPSDIHPYSYTIFRNGTQIKSGGWDESGVLVTVDGLAPGVYNYTIVAFDLVGNSVSDSVLVSVVPESSSTTQTTSIDATLLQRMIAELNSQVLYLMIGFAAVSAAAVVSLVISLILYRGAGKARPPS